MDSIPKSITELMSNAGTFDFNSWEPVIFNLGSDQDKKKLEALLKEKGAYITVHDELNNQLGELIKSQTPKKKFRSSELEKAILDRKEAYKGRLHELSNWVYYPWSMKLVHMLNKEDFIFTRTSRNMYKITPQERELLANKAIGVVGLSVGQSVSVTLAMERICGEIRLADFDILELTNLNRIRTGVHNLGLKKVYAVAREIAEIDPYITVRCFPEGLTEENMDLFFTDGKKLDLLIEESDGLDIKILSRFKAKSLGIPVLMEASDRCMVDVERFDLESNLPILHGLVGHLDPQKLKTLQTNEEKIPYMLDILGIHTLSTRLKASMLEIEQSITTWPQLASAVVMGGGITADVARRMLLNQFTESGRYYVDVEEIICNKQAPDMSQPMEATPPVKKETQGKNRLLEQAITTIQQTKITPPPNSICPTDEELKSIVNAACLAPSGGNSQPWHWLQKDQTLILMSPFSSHHTILGYNDRALRIAQGAALENLETRAAHLGLNTRVEILPKDYNNSSIIARIHFFEGPGKFGYSNLNSAIGKRLTNRSNEGRIEISQDILNQINTCVGEWGSHLSWFTQKEELTTLEQVLGEMERIRILEVLGHQDFVNEIRWTDEEAQRTRDGIELGSIDLSASERAGLQVAKDPKVISLLRDWNLGGAFSKLTEKTIESASAVGVLRMPDWSEESFLNGGRILERIWHQAQLLGFSFQPTAASVFMLYRHITGKEKEMSAQTSKLINNVLPKYNKALRRNTSQNNEVFIFRLNFAKHETQRSIRKHLSEVYTKL